MLYQWGAQFKDFNGADVTVSIEYKSILGEPVINYTFLPATASPVTITYYTKDENDVFSPILYSECALNIMLNDDDSSKQLLNTLNTALDGDYVLKVNIINGASEDTWYGSITTDQITKSVSYTGPISIKAICPLTYAKNQRLSRTDGTKFIGKHTLQEYIEAIITNALADYGTVPNIDFSISLVHDLILCNHTLYTPSLPYPDHTYFPDLFHQLSVEAYLFNDKDGRPMTAHDVLETICAALAIRLQFKNGVFDFRELLQIPFSGHYNVAPHGGLDTEEVNDIMLGNSERISKIRMFREAYVDCDYGFAYGLVRNGQLNDWTGGLPDSVDLKIMNTGAISSRKKGNGRSENPYGYLLKSFYNLDAGVEEFNNAGYDMMAFRTDDRDITPGKRIEIEVKAYIEDEVTYVQVPTEPKSNDIAALTYMICDTFIYNIDDPVHSYRLMYANDAPVWELIDLSSNTVFATGHYDFTINDRGAASAPVSPTPGTNENWNAFYFKFGYPIQFKAQGFTKQTGTITLPVAPCTGTLYIALSSIINPIKFSLSPPPPPDYMATVITSCTVNTGSDRKLNQEITGESVYLSRNLQSVKIKSERTIDMNTTADGTVSGSLYTDIAYRDSETWRYEEAGLVRRLNHLLYDYILGDTSLLKYNAFAMQSQNSGQQIVYCRTKAKKPTFRYYGVRFPSLVDPTHEDATSLFGSYHLTQRMVYDVKNCESEITAISMKANFREISTTTLDDNTDLLEEYNKQS